MTDIYKSRKYIVIGGDGLNPLGIIRSLGHEGIHADIIQFVNDPRISKVSSSKYVGKVQILKSGDELVSYLLDNYRNEALAPVLYFSDECYIEYIDNNYDLLKDRFIFSNSGKKGGVSKLNNKELQCILATQCGLRVPIYKVVKKVIYVIMYHTL